MGIVVLCISRTTSPKINGFAPRIISTARSIQKTFLIRGAEENFSTNLSISKILIDNIIAIEKVQKYINLK